MFLKVLKDAGAFNDNKKGEAAFDKCRDELFYNLKLI